MSSHKLAMQGDKHKRVRAPLATSPIIIGHEFCGELVEVGAKWKGQFKAGPEVRHPARAQLPRHPLGARLFLPVHRRGRNLYRDTERGHGARLPPRVQGRRLLHGLALRARVLHRRRLPRPVPHQGRILRPRDGHQGGRVARAPRERGAHGHRGDRLRDARPAQAAARRRHRHRRGPPDARRLDLHGRGGEAQRRRAPLRQHEGASPTPSPT